MEGNLALLFTTLQQPHYRELRHFWFYIERPHRVESDGSKFPEADIPAD
jgi:hypothetical protein